MRKPGSSPIRCQMQRRVSEPIDVVDPSTSTTATSRDSLSLPLCSLPLCKHVWFCWPLREAHGHSAEGESIICITDHTSRRALGTSVGMMMMAGKAACGQSASLAVPECLLRARLAALDRPTLPGIGQAIGRPATASGGVLEPAATKVADFTALDHSGKARLDDSHAILELMQRGMRHPMVCDVGSAHPAPSFVWGRPRRPTCIVIDGLLASCLDEPRHGQSASRERHSLPPLLPGAGAVGAGLRSALWRSGLAAQRQMGGSSLGHSR